MKSKVNSELGVLLMFGVLGGIICMGIVGIPFVIAGGFPAFPMVSGTFIFGFVISFGFGGMLDLL